MMDLKIIFEKDDMIKAAFDNSCLREDLSDELKKIFDYGLKLNSVIFRIKDMEPQIIERISLVKDDLLSKIKDNNNGQNAKASKYINAGLSSGNNAYFPKNKKMV